MLSLYTSFTGASAPLLRFILNRRCKRGKEDPVRISERMGQYERPRPDGSLLWVHAASVGEAQSALILIDAIKKDSPDVNILVTTGTLTSATLMEKRLPEGAFHQFYPLDHPRWVNNFLDHWRPDAALWLESELWPNMLMQLKVRDIPAALINARLSERSQKKWQRAPETLRKLLDSFNVILAQTEKDADTFKTFGAAHALCAGNLKYSATPLPYDKKEYEILSKAIGNRPTWLYASTHKGEEEIACRLHSHLQKKLPDLLTVIVPRHPERREEIKTVCEKYDMNTRMRSGQTHIPDEKTQIYVADTIGEMGLFYRLVPLACIGRSFSADGGGGHNPIEAAQLECAILHGPRVQNLQSIYDDMDQAGAALCLKDETDFQKRLERLMTDEEGLIALQNKALRFARQHENVLHTVMDKIAPTVLSALHEQRPPKKKAAL